MLRIITQGELATLFMCPRKHELSFRRGLEAIRRNVKLDEGSAAHEALATFYKGGTLQEAIASFDEKYTEHIQALEKNGQDPEESIQKLLRTRALVWAYLETQGKRDRDTYLFEKVEEEFLVPIYGPDGKELPGVRFGGKLDGIWAEKSSRIRMVVEHKFFSSFNETSNTLSLDLQVTMYALAAKTAFGVDVPVTLYNVCRKTGKEPKKGETHEEYFQRIYEEVLENQGEYFHRVPVTRGPQHFREAALMLYHGARMILGKSPLPYIYRNVSDQCLWKCSFQSICLEENPNILCGFYRKKPKLHPELEHPEEPIL